MKNKNNKNKKDNDNNALEKTIKDIMQNKKIGPKEIKIHFTCDLKYIFCPPEKLQEFHKKLSSLMVEYKIGKIKDAHFILLPKQKPDAGPGAKTSINIE